MRTVSGNIRRDTASSRIHTFYTLLREREERETAGNERKRIRERNEREGKIEYSNCGNSYFHSLGSSHRTCPAYVRQTLFKKLLFKRGAVGMVNVDEGKNRVVSQSISDTKLRIAIKGWKDKWTFIGIGSRKIPSYFATSEGSKTKTNIKARERAREARKVSFCSFERTNRVDKNCC